MLRLVLLALVIAPVFAGFASLFLVRGGMGLAIGAALIVGGSVGLWIVEKRTRQWLDDDSTWNRFMKSDGQDIIETKESD